MHLSNLSGDWRSGCVMKIITRKEWIIICRRKDSDFARITIIILTLQGLELLRRLYGSLRGPTLNEIEIIPIKINTVIY